MTRSKRFLSGVLLGYTHQALMMLVGLWLTPFLLKRIGQHDYGIWVIGIQVLSYLALVDIGVVALLPREIAYATGRGGGTANSVELPWIMGRTMRVVLCQTPVVAIAAAAIWFLMPGTSQFRGFIGLIVVMFTVLFPFRMFRAALEGLQDLQFAGRLLIFAWFAGTATTVILVLMGFGLYALAIGWASSQVLVTAAMAYRVWSRFPQALPTKRSDFFAIRVGDYVKRGLWASMSQVAQPLLNGADVLIIGKMLGAASVVPYTCTGKLISILANQPQMLLEFALPGLSEIKAGESKEHILRVTSALTQASLILAGAVVCVFLAVNHGFVIWWVGPKQYSGYTLSFLMAVCMLLRNWNNTAVYSMFCFGLERRLSVMCLLDGLVTVGASYALITWLGPLGGPLGSIFSVSVVSLPANLSAVARETGVSLGGLLRPLMPWVWRFVLLLACTSLAEREWIPHTVIQIAAAGAIAGLVYTCLMLTIGRKSALWPYIVPRLTPIWSTIGSKFE